MEHLGLLANKCKQERVNTKVVFTFPHIGVETASRNTDLNTRGIKRAPQNGLEGGLVNLNSFLAGSALVGNTARP